MYIQGVSPHPAPRTLSPADVEANLEDEGESDNEETDIGPQHPVISGIMGTYLQLVTSRLKNELRYYITTSSPVPPLCLCL
jgi:hypothetical protein